MLINGSRSNSIKCIYKNLAFKQIAMPNSGKVNRSQAKQVFPEQFVDVGVGY